MNSLWPSRGPAREPAPTGRAEVDVTDTGVADIDPEQPAGLTPNPPSSPSSPTHPLLPRTAQPQPPPAVPPPPTHPAPAPGQQQQQGQQQSQPPPDSLSLAQLRRIVAEFPRASPVVYDFAYEDTSPAGEEIDEWFVYQFWQWVRLNAVQRAFQWQWDHDVGAEMSWKDADAGAKDKLVADALAAIEGGQGKDRSSTIYVVLYLVLGRWEESCGGPTPASEKDGKPRSVATPQQLDAMTEGVKMVARLGGIPTVWRALRAAFEPFWTDDPQRLQPGNLQETQDELMNLMTIMYMMIQMTLRDTQDMADVHSQLVELDPSLIDFMVDATSKLRWDDAGLLPQAQIFLLFWKSILLVLGGTKELEETKKATSETPDSKERGIITASPLDYHVFRQEITSKYPAYIPPQPVIPLDADNTSLLPPLPNHGPRNSGANGILPGPADSQSGGASILHQPVHIATPAPSPPPSPGVSGKGAKKQNYQTNQNFPFMYPPLDATSNSAGGKGNAGLQELLVGRKWEGSDIPASILEAGELFSERVRMTRATRQLWEERERFMRYERGWEDLDDDLIEELDLSSLSLEDREELGLLKKPDAPKVEDAKVDFGPNAADLDDRTKQRLQALEDFYGEALPQLQSVVIVLLKAVLINITLMVPQVPGPQQSQQQQPGAPANGARPNGGAAPPRGLEAAHGAAGPGGRSPGELSGDDVDATRTREITTKAVSAILLLLLKWLKVSHVLKYEYLTQLLLDSNYIPLLLKLFAHQDVQQAVDSKTDIIENSFFYFCNNHASGDGNNKFAEPTEIEVEEDEKESEDEAAPPPIKRRRSPPGPDPEEASQDGGGETAGAQAEDQQQQLLQPVRPEVDELGYPLGAMPDAPITDFSRRNFFSLINYLRVMQKLCKNKAHRNLLLVNYKSSNILRKLLKVPQPELRLYTLKLFKNQVPYCGRKWRQTNMRVITAVYLHCRPELRDEWLAGSDVDTEVEEALPLEQALRSLTHRFNVRRYPDKMAPGVRAALCEEQDFFMRELDKLDLSWADVGGDDMSEWEILGA